MTTKTYYSPFFPPVEEAGTSGTTIAVVPSQVVTTINTQLGNLSGRVDDLVANGVGDSTPPDVVTGLALTSAIVFDTDGSQQVVLSATWNASSASDFAYYVIALQEQGGGFVEFIVKGTSYNWQVRANRTFTAKVRAVDKFNNASSYSPVATINSASDTIPPGIPTAFTIEASLSTFFLSFTPPTDADLDVIEIWANSVNVLGSATKIAEVNGGSATIGAGMNTTKYFWLRSRDTSKNVSGFTASIGATTGTVSSGTIDTTPPANTATPNPLTSTLITQPDGTQVIRLYSTWTANTDSDLSLYEVEVEEAGTSLGIYSTPTNSFNLIVLGGVSYRVRIRALDTVSNRSAWSAWTAAHISIKDTAGPDAPYNLEVIPTFSTFRLQWVNPGQTDLAKVEIWEYTSNNLGAAAKLDTVIAVRNSLGTFTVSGNPPATTKFYWVRALDTSGNASPFSPVASGSTPRIGTTDIQPGGITTPLITVGSLNGDRVTAGTLTADKLYITGNPTADQMPAGIYVGATGTTIGVLRDIAVDPASRINVVSTTIDPGKILISGGTRLADWRNGTDLTKIEGGNIAANTITANKITIGNRGITAQGIEFQADPANNVISWSAGNIFYINDAGNPDNTYVSAGFATTAAGDYTYIYWTKNSGTLTATRVYQQALGNNVVHLATHQGGATIITNVGGTIINGSKITTGSIDSVQIKANAIQAYHILAGSITADRIQAGTLTGDRFNTGTSLPGTITVGTTGVSIGTVQSQANDPATRINQIGTVIDPGRILISGSTTLANWRNGGDNTKIEGGNIAANTITANKLTIGNRNVNFPGCDFSVNAAGTLISWPQCFAQWIDASGAPQQRTIAAGSGALNGFMYIVWFEGDTTFNYTLDSAYARSDNNICLATWQYGTKLIVNNYGGTIVDGDRITTGTITANKLSVVALSAISANIGLLRTATSGARTEIESNQIRVYDGGNVMRVRIGVW